MSAKPLSDVARCVEWDGRQTMFTRSTRHVTQPSCWFVARRFVVADGIRGWSLKSDSVRFISRCGALDAHCSISPVAYLCCRRASVHRAPGRAQHTWATEHTWAVSRHFKGRRHCDRQPDASFIFAVITTEGTLHATWVTDFVIFRLLPK